MAYASRVNTFAKELSILSQRYVEQKHLFGYLQRRAEIINDLMTTRLTKLPQMVADLTQAIDMNNSDGGKFINGLLGEAALARFIYWRREDYGLVRPQFNPRDDAHGHTDLLMRNRYGVVGYISIKASTYKSPPPLTVLSWKLGNMQWSDVLEESLPPGFDQFNGEFQEPDIEDPSTHVAGFALIAINEINLQNLQFYEKPANAIRSGLDTFANLVPG